MTLEFIRSVDLKLNRSQTQVQQLLESISNWVTKNPVTARGELRDNRLGYRLIMNEFTEPPPLDDWGLQIGELIHNLRSSLDNLAFALARLRKDPPNNPRKIAFPIYEDKKRFNENFNPIRKYFPDEVSDLIERIEPFQRDGTGVEGTPDQDGLAMLQHLNNVDKHRVPGIVLFAPIKADGSFAIEFNNSDDATANIPPDCTISAAPLHPGLVLVEHRTKHPIASVKGEFSWVAQVSIKTEEKALHVNSGIPQLYTYSALIVSEFRRFFL